MSPPEILVKLTSPVALLSTSPVATITPPVKPPPSAATARLPPDVRLPPLIRPPAFSDMSSLLAALVKLILPPASTVNVPPCASRSPKPTLPVASRSMAPPVMTAPVPSTSPAVALIARLPPIVPSFSVADDPAMLVLPPLIALAMDELPDEFTVSVVAAFVVPVRVVDPNAVVAPIAPDVVVVLPPVILPLPLAVLAVTWVRRAIESAASSDT